MAGHRARRGAKRVARPGGATPPPKATRADRGEVRLQKILAAAGIASRRQAEGLLRQGRVEVNGRVAELGDVADPRQDKVSLDGEPVNPEALAYWIANKPVGMLSTVSDPEGRPIVLDLLPATGRRLFPVGRLDRDTQGLVLLTNDGALAHTLLHPSRESEREYRVTVKGLISKEALDRLAAGIRLEDGVTAPAGVARVAADPATGTTEFSLTLIEGRKRQIRRALWALRHPVVRLVRVRMGPLSLGRLACGEARRLRPSEIRELLAHARRLEAARAGPKRA